MQSVQAAWLTPAAADAAWEGAQEAPSVRSAGEPGSRLPAGSFKTFKNRLSMIGFGIYVLSSVVLTAMVRCNLVATCPPSLPPSLSLSLSLSLSRVPESRAVRRAGRDERLYGQAAVLPHSDLSGDIQDQHGGKPFALTLCLSLLCAAFNRVAILHR